MLNSSKILRLLPAIILIGIVLSWENYYLAHAVGNDFKINKALLNFKNLTKRANKENLQLKFTRKSNLASEIAQKSSGTLPEPRIGFHHFTDSVETRTGPQENIISLSQTVPWINKLRLQKNIASLNAETSRETISQTQISIIEQLSQIYFNCIYLENEFDIETKNFSYIEYMEYITKEKISSGTNLNDFLQIEIEGNVERDNLAEIKINLANKLIELSTLAGYDIKAIDHIMLPELAKILNFNTQNVRKINKEKIFANFPILKILAKKTEILQRQEKLQKLDWIPDPTFNLKYIDIGNGGEDAVSVGISFNLPIWAKKNKAEINQASTLVQATKANLNYQKSKIIQQYHTLLAQIQQNISRAKIYQNKILPSAKHNVEVSQEQYSGNKINISTYIDTLRQKLQVEKKYLRTLIDIHILIVKLKLITDYNAFFN